MTARALLVVALAALTGCAFSGPVGDYSVGGTVSGLSTNSGVLLTDAAGAGVFVSGNGRFSIDSAFVDGEAYDVVASTDPGTPKLRCLITGGKGVIAGADVNDVNVACAPAAFELGGKVSGINAVGLILSSRGTEIALSKNGTFTFGTITNGSSYAVTVEQSPDGETCSISNGSGTVDGADVSVSVVCAPVAAASADDSGTSKEAEEEPSEP